MPISIFQRVQRKDAAVKPVFAEDNFTLCMVFYTGHDHCAVA